jgi:uncharacterized protein DUF2125
MIHSRLFSGACSAALIAFAPAAYADITAREAWDSFKAYAEISGQNIEVGSESESGGTLLLSDVQVSMLFPGGAARSELSSLSFNEQNDGSVAITLSPDYTISVNGEDVDGEQFDMRATLTHEGMNIIAAGEPEAVTWTYTANMLKLAMNMAATGGADDADVTVDMSVADMAGSYAFAEGESADLAYDTITGAVRMDMTVSESDHGAQVRASLAFDGMEFAAEGALPVTENPEDFARALFNAGNLTGAYSLGAGTFALNVTEDGENFDLTGSSGGSEVNFAIQDGGFAYDTLTSNIDVTVASNAMPMPPVTVTLAEYGASLEMPMAQSDEPGDFGLGLRFVGLSVPEDLWRMFDPSKVLPRSPATFILDLSGKANWLFDIFDQDAAAAMEETDEMPGELHALTLDALQLSLGGAELTGSGAFTFDNSDLETFDGLPAPEGVINLNLSGGNGLLDKLVQLGFIESQDAMGMRMMMGMFSVVAEGEDKLTSEIKVSKDGQVFANGQRLQ